MNWLSLQLHGPEDRPAGWKKALGQNYELFKQAFLDKRPEPARYYFCERCYSDHIVIHWTLQEWERAFGARIDLDDLPDFVRRGDIIARWQVGEFCADIPLRAEDIEVWQLNWPRFARAIARAFELDIKLIDLKLNHTHTWQLGTWSSDAVPVILVMEPGVHELRAILMELIMRFGHKFIVLTPTTKYIDLTIQELLNKTSIQIFPLDTTVRFTHNGTFQSIRPPGELFAKFTPQPKETDLNDARRAYALAKNMDLEGKMEAPTPFTVFHYYFVENMTAGQIAVECKCSKGTIIGRLKLIRKRTGKNLQDLRGLSSHFAKIENEMREPRARRVFRKGQVQDSEDEFTE